MQLLTRTCARGTRLQQKEAVLSSIRCQTSFDFTPAVKPRKSTGPSVGGAPENEILAGCRSFPLALSIAKLDPDAGHARRLIQRTNGLAEPRPELGGAVLVTVCRSRCDR